jgi:hypothetical protein
VQALGPKGKAAAASPCSTVRRETRSEVMGGGYRYPSARRHCNVE